MKKLKDYIHYQSGDNLLLLGDNKDILPLLDSKFKLCFTSPPYNLGQQIFRRSTFFGRGNSKGKNKVYDKYNDNLPYKTYQLYQHRLIESIFTKLLTQDGAIFYNHKPIIRDGIFDDRKGLIPYPIRQEIIWQKGMMINFNGCFFAPNTERIYIIAKKDWKPNRDYLSLGEIWKIPQDKMNPHPAPFPMALAMQVILSSTNKGDWVLDPYIGSGTTFLACERLGRKWIGIDISEAYLNQAIKRIENEEAQGKFF